MKLIIAIIRPERLDAVQAALQKVLDEGDNYRLTVSTVDGHGRQEGEVEFFRGQAVRTRLVQKCQITIGVNEAYVDRTIDAIIHGARTNNSKEGGGEVGDGKIFVVPLESCVRIRTGERGGSAI
jgi:nitrogen regulatory protein P-II 2